MNGRRLIQFITKYYKKYKDSRPPVPPPSGVSMLNLVQETRLVHKARTAQGLGILPRHRIWDKGSSDTLFHGFGYGIQRIWEKSPGTLGLGQGIAISRGIMLVPNVWVYPKPSTQSPARERGQGLGMDMGVSTRTHRGVLLVYSIPYVGERKDQSWRRRSP